MKARVVSVADGSLSPAPSRSALKRSPRTNPVRSARIRGPHPETTPGDLLLAALGSCTSVAVRAHANRCGWPLDEVVVTARFDRQERSSRTFVWRGIRARPRQGVAGTARCILLTREASIVTVPTVLSGLSVARSRTVTRAGVGDQ
ncbi:MULTISPECIES: OsmC family protein [unclassified Streptomyces]|uniref:OsmC family protein n=1 Tax=unclassified Streptomyces TaxID=2593676 RepID=UPI001F0EC33D|nr:MULTISPECIES: OsmC family protein [unclassified Streptomyces]